MLGCAALAVAFAAGPALVGGAAAAASAPAASAPVVLHFQGNVEDSGGDPPTPCAGVGAADIINCGGPFLRPDGALSSNPAAQWVIASPALDGTNGRTLYDANWIWNSGPTRLGGHMRIDWWATCGACGAAFSADWTIRLFVDDAATPVFEKRVTAAPALPNVPEKLTTTVFLPEIIAQSNIVLHVDPVYIDSQNATRIYYDSQLPCPGATGGEACDSTVAMPVLAPGEVAPTPDPTPTPGATPGPDAPRFFNYTPPPGMGTGAAEPTLGVNWQSGRVMFIAGLETLQVTFDDSSSPAKATWVNKSSPTTPPQTLDPMLFTDSDVTTSRTNRTFVSQLLGKASAMAFTDDDGDTWTPSQGSGINSGVDHQTIGGGPYAKNPDGSLKGGASQRQGPDGKIYPHAIYYASQDIGMAQIARSDDGGFTFGVAIPMWNLTQCAGLHGQIKVAPDGTVYVPNPSCGSGQGLAVSEDNGVTWNVRVIPGSTASANDPSLGIGADGTIYFGYANNGDSEPTVAVSRDKGLTWSFIRNVDTGHGLRNVAFPAVVAGDGDRAAMFFLGSTSPGGAAQGDDPNAWDGAWYGYIALTYDRGEHWVTVNATPNDPVQLGVVCNAGTLCADGTRNLLDFNDATIDKQGRVLAGFADGCISPQCIAGVDRNGPDGTPDGHVNNHDNDKTELATIIRQAGGKGLIAAYDPPAKSAPAAPGVIAGRDRNDINVTWTTPDHGGSPITGYNVYRGAQGGTAAATKIASVAGNVNSYTDETDGGDYFYQVSAVNANGEGARSLAAVPRLVETACKAPGLTLGEDTVDGAPNVPAQPGVDIKQFWAGEPYFEDGSSKLVFTIKVGPASAPVPNSQWFIIFGRKKPDASHDRNYVAMRTNSSGVPTFEHGRVSYPLAYTAPEPNQGNLPTKFGDAEGTYDPQAGLITIKVRPSVLDNLLPGDTMLGLEARSFLGRNDNLPLNQNLSSDFALGGQYTLVGNLACRTNAAPTAALSVSALSGDAPLAVIFNGSGSSDPDTGAPADTIASYTFDFGDGSAPVTQAAPTASHTYTKAGRYTATLRVTDSRGKASENAASVEIEVISRLGVALSPASVVGGKSSLATVTLSAPAPAGGAEVLLSSGDTNAATVRASVTVPAGATTRSFTVTTKPVASLTAVNIAASYAGQTGTAVLEVAPPALTGLTLSPSTITGPCESSAGTVTISGKAPAGGLAVALSTTNAGAGVPSSVTIPAGATSATFTVTASNVASKQTGTVTASAGSVSLSKTLTVAPNGLKALTLSPSSVTGPAPSTGTVTLSCAAPSGGLLVSLSSSAPSVAKPAVSSILIPAGATSASFKVETADVVSAGSATIRATAKGVTKTAKLTVK